MVHRNVTLASRSLSQLIEVSPQSITWSRERRVGIIGTPDILRQPRRKSGLRDMEQVELTWRDCRDSKLEKIINFDVTQNTASPREPAAHPWVSPIHPMKNHIPHNGSNAVPAIPPELSPDTTSDPESTAPRPSSPSKTAQFDGSESAPDRSTHPSGSHSPDNESAKHPVEHQSILPCTISLSIPLPSDD